MCFGYLLEVKNGGAKGAYLYDVLGSHGTKYTSLSRNL
ncbi:hypothetical protein P678_0465 [Acinetobacter baumannii UH7807]|uniref:Uncharacterized protein n=2 Tax=Acinetobacter baumannii TaxID=470 RepID=A0ABC9V5G9_ACIBA|nr:hypothetical protein ACINIS58_2749 [Acinetobacter baumannii IS-58]EKL51226.1 hypothetical protein ACINNAV83_1806 [Acinetobacter baumannii Naval-83]ETP78043.1 hypothetical protein P641_0231 [Acinetobacter baumannii UH0807]ETP80209.1 hypothetical protein P640_0164 [Acinetobacter baumannii UH0707]ETP89069.1 hypothetical protein P644_1524 [Acinetobacter baumannii UH10107]ETQ02272.1 hypothetical protein P643_3426 [Acinetobacter baumannii UH10007]ETQ29610.1 hypothetical protein P654_0397 [Acinet